MRPILSSLKFVTALIAPLVVLAGGVASGQSASEPIIRFDWSVFEGTVENDSAAGIVPDRFGNVYVTGSTAGAFPNYTNQGQMDGYLLRCYQDGTSVRVIQWGDAAQDQPHAIAVNSQGDVSIVGIKRRDRREPVGFVRTYDIAGRLLADREVRVSSFTWPESCIYDRFGNLYIAGLANSNTPGNGAIAFVRKFSRSGRELWTTVLGDAPGEYATAQGVAIAPDDSVVVAGYAYSRFNGEPTNGRSDGITARLGANGRVIWTRRSELPGSDWSWGITVKRNGELFVPSEMTSLSAIARPTDAIEDILSAEWLLAERDRLVENEKWLIRVMDLRGGVKRDLVPGRAGAAKSVAFAADGNLWVTGRSGMMFVDEATGDALFQAGGFPTQVVSDGDRAAYFVGASRSHNGSPSVGGVDVYIDKFIGPPAPAIPPARPCLLHRLRNRLRDKATCLTRLKSK